MANSITGDLNIVAKKDGQSDSLREFDAGISDSWTEESAGTVNIAASGNADIGFGGVTNAKWLFLMATIGGVLAPFTFTLNGGAEALPSNGLLVLTGNDTQSLTAINVVNVDAEDAIDVEFVIVG